MGYYTVLLWCAGVWCCTEILYISIELSRFILLCGVEKISVVCCYTDIQCIALWRNVWSVLCSDVGCCMHPGGVIFFGEVLHAVCCHGGLFCGEVYAGNCNVCSVMLNVWCSAVLCALKK